MSEWSLQVSCYIFHNNGEDLLLGRFSATFYQLLNGPKKFMVFFLLFYKYLYFFLMFKIFKMFNLLLINILNCNKL